ncbi:aldehyde ferredoxin oxidoreductase family protein [Chloroflexota bacterium]
MATKMPGGYAGKILRINLSENKISTEELDEMFCRKYIGGAGFISYYMLKEIKRGIDPLGPENKLIFALGPVTGVQLPGSARNCVGGKSPLTGGIAKSEVGGFWGAELKRAGFDGIIVEGKADKPVYIWIEDSKVEIKDASNLWGMATKETEQAIRKAHGDDHIRVASIGPGGERMVRYACIMNDLKDAAGRGGMGAVMGSKNLKAIGIRGHKAPKIANPDRIKELRQFMVGNRPAWAGFADYGTGGEMAGMVTTGNTPVRNFQDGLFPDVDKIDGKAIANTIRIKMEGCFACPVRCKKVVQAEKPYSIDPDYGGPEYESIASLGSNCGVSDLNAMSKANELCNAYSLDSISAGVAISFAMECFENGLISSQDTGGIDLRFGNGEAVIQAVELIAKREGIGDLLAEGTARAAEKIGKGAEKYAMHVKGLEIPMHEPRVKAGLGLGYVVNPHGADHCANLHDTMFTQMSPAFEKVKTLGILEPVPADDLGPKKVSMFKEIHQSRIVADSLVTCMFVPWSIDDLCEILNAVTGWNTSTLEMLRAAERTLTALRLFNIREGFTAADDKLPQRFFGPKRDGVLTTSTYNEEALNNARSYYYTLMGWDAETGVPLPAKVEDLGLD